MLVVFVDDAKNPEDFAYLDSGKVLWTHDIEEATVFKLSCTDVGMKSDPPAPADLNGRSMREIERRLRL